IEQLNLNDKKVIKSKKLKLKTVAIDDKLPAIYIEKRVPGSIQPGFNLASYNLKDEGLPFTFDSMGNIRYILKTGKEMRKVKIEKEDSGVWEVKNDEDKFQLDILGKILGRIGRDDEDIASKNRKTKYLVRNNNMLTVVSYRDGAYPTALFSEYGLDSKDEIFKAIIFYDKNGADENIIEDGERVVLYEGDSES
ncbi:MAG: aryl-sulfate sulfotransferase, partial [Cetobacterium sp.]